MKICNIVLLTFLLFPITISADNFMRERVYLHTDKQTYLSGELMWVKFYLTDEAGKPSSFSKVGYVELADETVAQVQVKLEIIDGIACGWLELPISLPTGNYRLIGYTRNMRNEGEKVFFNKTIGVINTFRAGALVSTDTIADSEASTAATAAKGNISVTSGQSYSTRDNGTVRISGLPENIHSLSVSVTGKDIIQGDNDILVWNNGLKSYANVSSGADFLPEYEGHIITAKITHPSSNQDPGADRVFPLLGFVGNQPRVFGGMITDNKNVQFFTKRITGMKELAVSTTSASGSQYLVDIESPYQPHSEKEMPAFLLDPAWESQLLQRSIGLQVQHAYTADLMNQVDTTYSFFRWKPDRSYILDEYTRFPNMEEIVIEFISVLRFRNYGDKTFLTVLLNESNLFSEGNSLVLLDGIPVMDHKIIAKYNPLLVHKIEIYKDVFVFGTKRYEGLVSITTYKNDYPGFVTDGTTRIFDYEGTQLHRYFYSPSYIDEPDKQMKTPDYRHTLLWKPEIKTDGETEISVPFYTSDITGDFHVTVEGITKDGRAIRGTCSFNVHF